jgi:hypothetical protein
LVLTPRCCPQSVIIPVVLLSAIMFISLKSAGMYGVALAALGMLSTLATCLAIDVYGLHPSAIVSYPFSAPIPVVAPLLSLRFH